MATRRFLPKEGLKCRWGIKCRLHKKGKGDCLYSHPKIEQGVSFRLLKDPKDI